MNNRDKAVELANSAIERIESGSTMPDTQDVMSYALVLVLADISKRLQEIEEAIGTIYVDGVGVG